MAERRPPGFNVDLGFYDSAEVLSIPRKLRASAVGVWTLCGAYSAAKMSDGYVPEEKLRDLGCTPTIRAALCATTPDPLWMDDEKRGGIQFTRWPKWQRTAAEIKAFRDADAERKRVARESKRGSRKPHVSDTYGLLHADVDGTCAPDDAHVSDTFDRTSASRNGTKGAVTSGNSEMSGRTRAGHTATVRPDSRTPKSETESETESESFPVVDLGGGVASVGPAVCPRHPNGNPNDEDCRGCGEVRRSAKAFAAAADELAAQRRNRAAAERQAAIDACDICDEHGQIDYGNSIDTCDHGLEADHA